MRRCFSALAYWLRVRLSASSLSGATCNQDNLETKKRVVRHVNGNYFSGTWYWFTCISEQQTFQTSRVVV